MEEDDERPGGASLWTACSPGSWRASSCRDDSAGGWLSEVCWSWWWRECFTSTFQVSELDTSRGLTCGADASGHMRDIRAIDK